MSILTILFAILMFSFLIFIHELGHFIAAKSFGVQVNEFSLFMGPALWKKQKGETLYAIRLIPIGGFCAMEGEDGDSDSPRSFTNAAWWKRLIILVAGAAVNFVAGVILLGCFFLPQERFNLPVIAEVYPECTFAGESGIQVGDRVLEVDGEKIYTYSDFTLLTGLRPSDTHDLVLLRDGEKVILNDLLMEKHEIRQEDGTMRLLYGFSFGSTEATFPELVKYTWNNALDNVRLVRLSLQLLVTGQAGLKDVSGPVGIVQQMSEVAQESGSLYYAFLNMIYFTGFIAINLAVMNLLPIPALDGGRAVGVLLTAAVEKITRRKLDPKYEGYVHGAGMILLLALMAVIMFKDIFVIVKG